MIGFGASEALGLSDAFVDESVPPHRIDLFDAA
jgi:hypothetical protein